MRDATGAYRHAVLIGGTSEIGLAIVRHLVARGTRKVTLAARDTAAAAVVSLDAGVETCVVTLDVLQPATHVAVAEEIVSAGDIDLVIVATGMLGDAEKAAHDPAYAAQIIDTTFTGTATITGALADILERQGHGTLVVMSSVAGYRVRGDNHVYGAAKAGLDGFAQGLAMRLHGSGVHTLIVRPGFVRTRMSTHVKEAPFANDADDVANDVIAALEKGRTVVWSPGTLKFVMGILRHLPSAVFRRVAAGNR